VFFSLEELYCYDIASIFKKNILLTETIGGTVCRFLKWFTITRLSLSLFIQETELTKLV